MKADEYQVLVMAVEEGVAQGFRSIQLMTDYDIDSDWRDSKSETKMVDSVLDSVLSWFHIERPWMKELDV